MGRHDRGTTHFNSKRILSYSVTHCCAEYSVLPSDVRQFNLKTFQRSFSLLKVSSAYSSCSLHHYIYFVVCIIRNPNYFVKLIIDHWDQKANKAC